MPDENTPPIYLAFDGERIMDRATVRKVGGAVWIDMQMPGMLLRLVLTPKELDDLIDVCETVRADLEAEG